MMHGQKNIKSILVSSVGPVFSYVNDARSHEPEAHTVVFGDKSSAGAGCSNQSHILTTIISYLTKKNHIYSCNHCCRGKEISVTYSECVFVPLVIQHAMRISHIILPSVTCLDLQYFSAYLI